MKVGDYVRTKESGFQYPQIARIVKMEKDEGYKNQYYITLDHNLLPDYEFNIYTEDIDESRSKVIELVQVGDYVNGGKVNDKRTDEGNEWFIEVDEYLILYNEDIKSIVTKEQFESMKYKVK